MKHIKYSNTMVMYIISIGYVILVLIALFRHLNIMYILAPYALLTFWCIDYTQKRSTNFTAYRIGFELGINEHRNCFKFYILGSDANGDIEILKLNHYQTQYIIIPLKLQAMLTSLGYSIYYLPVWESQIVTPTSNSGNQDIDTPVSHYEQIASEYKTIKAAIISNFKQNLPNLLESNISQPVFNYKPGKRKSITSFLRQ